MYHPEVVAARLAQILASPLGAAFKAQFGGAPSPIPAEECHQRTRQLAAIWDARKGAPSRKLTEEEQRFVTNERILSKIDYRYFAERYSFIIHPAKGLTPIFPLFTSQELILGAIARVEHARWKEGHPDGLLCNILKGRQLGACLKPSTRVLTADLVWVPAESLVVGTEIVAVDEESPAGRGNARRMRTAVVEAKAEVLEPACEIVLASGATVTCSLSHRWLYRTRTQTYARWRTTADMRVGGSIRRITELWGASSLEDYWMGGMLDGEGSGGAKVSGGAEFTISQRPGPVFERLRQYFAARGYAAQEDADQTVRRTKFGKTPVPRFSLSRMNELFRLIGQTRPTRFLPIRWWEGKTLPGKRVGGYGWDRIVAIRPLGPRRLIDLQTSTGTFIAEGLVSHNSTLCQSILAHRAMTQTYTKGLIASDVPQNSGSTGLFGMLELTVEHTPWWLKPGEQYHTKDHHIVFTNHSSVVVESGKSMKGALQDDGGSKGQIGRSKTYGVSHLSELSTWENAGQIDDALMPAIPMTPRTFMAKESTAKGRHNWWHKEWMTTQAGNGRSFNIFIPWYAERSKYWAPCPTNWDPPDSVIAYAARVAEHGPRWMGGETYRLSKEQLYWYFLQRRAAEDKGTLYKFLEEYPAEPEEAFQYSGRSIFTPAQIDYLRNAAKPARFVYRVLPNTLIADLRDHQLSPQDLEDELSMPRHTAGIEEMT